MTWSGKLQWKDTTENTAGRLSPLVSGETAEWCHRNRKDGSEKCFCKTAAERPLSASDYKFIFCKGTFWHNVQRKDIKCNLSANETKKWMRRRERQHILLKYVDMPLRSQCVPPSDTKRWNVLISADNIYTEKASNTSFKVPKTSIALSRRKRVGWEPSATLANRQQSLCTISPASLVSILAALTYLLPEVNWGPWKPYSLCFLQQKK